MIAASAMPEIEMAAEDVSLLRYDSPAELRRVIESLDCDDGHALTVLVALDRSFVGHLPSLVARRHPALALVLAVDERLPGLVTIGDLAMTCRALGWWSIILERHPERAYAELVASRRMEERLVVLWPSTRPSPA